MSSELQLRSGTSFCIWVALGVAFLGFFVACVSALDLETAFFLAIYFDSLFLMQKEPARCRKNLRVTIWSVANFYSGIIPAFEIPFRIIQNHEHEIQSAETERTCDSPVPYLGSASIMQIGRQLGAGSQRAYNFRNGAAGFDSRNHLFLQNNLLKVVMQCSD